MYSNWLFFPFFPFLLQKGGMKKRRRNSKAGFQPVFSILTIIIYRKDEEFDSVNNFTGLILNFAEQVSYTTKHLAYGPSEFLIDMGSSLGLWFGLSVFGITDLVSKAFQLVKNTRQEVIRKFRNSRVIYLTTQKLSLPCNSR